MTGAYFPQLIKARSFNTIGNSVKWHLRERPHFDNLRSLRAPQSTGHYWPFVAGR